MKKILLFTVLSTVSSTLMAQTQIGNGDMESWETVAGSDEEPVNFNSFLTASGSWAWAAANQIEQSADVRPGTSGTTSCRIWSRSTFGIVANGNVTTGRIEMGSTTPTDPSNYNYTITADADFNQAMPDSPDSIVFWAKFTPNGHNENARMKATIHADYDYRDPEDAASSAEVVATAVLNYPNTNGWMRMSVPFNYSGPASTPAYILVTFTTNEVGGGGAADDEVLIDDIELIYNGGGAGVEEIVNNINVFMNNEADVLTFESTKPFDGTYEVYDLTGKVVQGGKMMHEVQMDVPTGIYIINTNIGGITNQYKIYKK